MKSIKYFLSIILCIWLFFYLNYSNWLILLNFNSILEWMSNRFSNVHFALWWNNFLWWIIWLNSNTLTTPITINYWWSSKVCYKQLDWIYFNSARWLRTWPMTSWSLSFLKTYNSSYNNLNLSWWFYSACNWEPFSIYWIIEYTKNSHKTYLIWWVTMDANWNKYTSTWFSQNFQYMNWTVPIWYIFDSQWWIWFVWWEFSWNVYTSSINMLNNWSWINQIFNSSWNILTANIWWTIYTADGSSINWWINTMSKLWILWILWFSRSWAVDAVRQAIISNIWRRENTNSQKISFVDWWQVNFKNSLNYLKKKTYYLCNWKRTTDNITTSPWNWQIFCYDWSWWNWDQSININTFQWKTVIVKNANLTLTNLSLNNWSIDIFVDEWNLILENSAPDSDFNMYWEEVTSNWVTEWIKIVWNIFVNWLLLWDWSNNTFNHKLYIYWKLMSLNTLWEPTNQRKTFVNETINDWNNYDDKIKIDNVFDWTCDVIEWIWNDWVDCSITWDIYKYNSLIIIDRENDSLFVDK